MTPGCRTPLRELIELLADDGKTMVDATARGAPSFKRRARRLEEFDVTFRRSVVKVIEQFGRLRWAGDTVRGAATLVWISRVGGCIDVSSW